jgi:hypothetical protein
MRVGTVRWLTPAAVVLAAVSLALGVLGVGVEHWNVPAAFNLDLEWRVPAFWSAGLLAAAVEGRQNRPRGGSVVPRRSFALAAWRMAGGRPRRHRWALGLAVLYAFMAADELSLLAAGSSSRDGRRR